MRGLATTVSVLFLGLCVLAIVVFVRLVRFLSEKANPTQS